LNLMTIRAIKAKKKKKTEEERRVSGMSGRPSPSLSALLHPRRRQSECVCVRSASVRVWPGRPRGGLRTSRQSGRPAGHGRGDGP
jgi:hypothetical protein